MKQREEDWKQRQADKAARLKEAAFLAVGKWVAAEDTVRLLEAVIRPFDLVNIEGDNQKQADFLAKALCQVNEEKIHDLHMVQSTLALPSHLELFEKGIAHALDFAYAGSQGKKLAQLIKDGKVQLGAIHTYLELYGRYFIDLIPKVCLLAAEAADEEGNLYTGASTEDTAVIAEATAFHEGIVIVQVNRMMKKLPRIDIPSDWVDFVIESPEPYVLQPLFTRDPAHIDDERILKAMMVIKGIYSKYGIEILNHGVGYDTAAVELLLPTYGEELGLKGKICKNWILNPHPTMIPAMERGWVKQMYCFGSEVGMEKYIAARRDLFPIGPDGTMRSNRAFAQVAGHYAADLFIGATMQIDEYGNSSTATKNNIAGFGGAPNMGCDAHGRRHVTEAWKICGQSNTVSGASERGRKLVVQLITTVSEKGFPGFVKELDAVTLQHNANLALPPVMIYGDDVTHIVSEIGIAYLHQCQSMEERKHAIQAIAGQTDIGMMEDTKETKKLRELGIVVYPEDLGIDRAKATKNLLAAKTMKELADWSNRLYEPPEKFRNW